MLLTKARKATSVIGVDFGACSLRAVQLRRDGDAWRVHHWVNLETEPTSGVPTPPHSPQDLELAFGPGAFTGSHVALTMSPPDVAYQLLDLPAAVLSQPPPRFRAALQIELDRQMPWPVAESELASWSVKPDATGSVPAVIVAARRAALEQQLDLLTAVDLECDRADVVPNAMIALHQNGGLDTTDIPADVIWGIMDIGFSSCRLYLVHDNRPVYARVLRGGGCEFTNTLVKTLKVDFSIAERYKRIYGIKATERGFRSMLGGLSRITEEELPGVLYAICKPLIEVMVKEIERSYRFVMGQFPRAQAGTIYLIGGGARLQGLVEVLSSSLGVTVSVPKPGTLFGTEKGRSADARHPLCKPSNYVVLAPCAGMVLKESSS